MLLQIANFPLFVWLSSILLFLFINSSVGGYLVSSHILAIINIAAMNNAVNVFFEWVVLISLGIYPGVELLYQMVVWFSVFLRNIHSVVAIQIYISTNIVHEISFLHILSNICYLCSVWWYLFRQLGDIWIWFWCAYLYWSVILSTFYVPAEYLCAFLGRKFVKAIWLYLIGLFDFFDIELYQLFTYLKYCSLLVISIENTFFHIMEVLVGWLVGWFADSICCTVV